MMNTIARRSARAAIVAAKPTQQCVTTTAVLTFSKGSTQRSVFHLSTYALAVLVPAGVAMGGTAASVADMALAGAIPIHTLIGMRSVILDYVKPDSVQKVSLLLATLFCTGMGVSLVKFNLDDVGMIEGAKSLWRPAKKSE